PLHFQALFSEDFKFNDKFPIKKSLKLSRSISLLSSPFFVHEIAPVSSETTIVRASVTSLIPIAARCLVPNSLEMKRLSDNGRDRKSTRLNSSHVSISYA